MMSTIDCLIDILYYSISLNSHRMCGLILCEEFFREDLAYFRTNFPAGINVDYGDAFLERIIYNHCIEFSGQNFASKGIKKNKS